MEREQGRMRDISEPEPSPGASRHPLPQAGEGTLRRIRIFSAGAYVAFAIWMLAASGWWGFAGLTCSAAVVMINFLWLEEVVENLLQPAPHLHAWRLTLRALARFALLGVALLVTIFVARFNALSVLLGFSIVVVGIIGEALYAVYRSLAE
ncbi:MAG TPA: hypothetical protein VNA04_13955 [Thermoanaerobaculia bacterium]|nr:hypothetical protein [Thermoanaerobaculia bacterium]